MRIRISSHDFSRETCDPNGCHSLTTTAPIAGNLALNVNVPTLNLIDNFDNFVPPLKHLVVINEDLLRMVGGNGNYAT
jgi:hypothetical protein